MTLLSTPTSQPRSPLHVVHTEVACWAAEHSLALEAPLLPRKGLRAKAIVEWGQQSH